MKTKLFFFGIAISMAMCFIYSCNKDEIPVPEVKGGVVFGFSANGEVKSAIGLKSAEALEDASFIIVTIINNEGAEVYSQEQLPLINMNGSFITHPISLLVGDYTVTEFIVVDEDGNALYIAPLEGSSKAYLVDDPIPIEFSVSKDEVLKLLPEVLSTENAIPEDFGYTTFSFEVVETFDFLIGVFVYNDLILNYELTTASLTVEADGALIYSGLVEAITDTVTLNDGYFEYIVTVEKEGYSTYVDTFLNAELKLYYSSEDNGPLVVVLEASEIIMGQPCPGTPTVTDADGNVYPTVQIGDQCWMAENLKVGNQINASDVMQDNGIIEKVCYDNDIDNCDIYGGLYIWKEAMQYDTLENSKGICADGWHIPNHDEIVVLSNQFADKYVAYNELIMGGSTGFNARLSGFGVTNGDFHHKDSYGVYPSSTIVNSDDVMFFYFDNQVTDPNAKSAGVAFANISYDMYLTIRCIKD